MTKESVERTVNLKLLEQIKNNPGRGQEFRTTFEAFVGEVRFTTTGDAVFRLTVPFEHRQAILQLPDTYGELLDVVITTKGIEHAQGSTDPALTPPSA